MRAWLLKFRPILVALGAWVAANCWDIITSEFVMAYVPGSIEGNVLMRDPETLKFAIVPAIFFKLFWLISIDTPLVLVIYAATKRAKWAAIPLWFSVYSLLVAAAGNMINFMIAGR